MPKEKIYDAVEMYDVEVGWSTSGEYVAVGVVTHDGRSIADALNSELADPATDAKAEPGRIGMVNPNRSDPTPDQEGAAQFSSLWATLDRRQINRLIYVLRRARDAAYGRDE